ncbi:MAG TPA: response regulator [Gemmatimonadales bacterium]
MTDRSAGRPRANALIAVVDDDEEVRRALGRLLRSAGFAVLPFETAEQFLANDPQETDCLVADICLPGMSGTDLEDHLARSAPRLPVVLITALDDVATTERLKRSRAITVLQKPFADHALFAAIERGLASNQTGSQLDP